MEGSRSEALSHLSFGHRHGLDQRIMATTIRISRAIPITQANIHMGHVIVMGTSTVQ